MAHEITVNVSPATDELIISGYPEGVVISDTTSSNPYIVAEPSNTVNVIGESGATIVDVNTFTDNSADLINIGAQLNVTIGTLFESPITSELDGFKYSFPNFVDSGTSSFVYGDIVYLESNISETSNDWGANCIKANNIDVYSGAFNNLFVFISHINNNLIILHKGFFDLEDVNITQWTAGRTLYLNSQNKLDITPTSLSGSWVRSLGFCVPNKNNRKRIWFEPDSTYIKIN